MLLNIQIFKQKIERLVIDISNNKFAEIEKSGENGRLTADDMKRVIKEYGCTIIPLPNNAFEYAESYYIEKEDRLDIYIPLWTKEENRSDLTLSISCSLINETPFVKINDLRVL
jgi:hypothetical protein